MDIRWSSARAQQQAIKRALDWIVALMGCIVLSPLFILLGILIKLDSRGPIFFRQNRLGQFGKPFSIYKFRTMIANAPDWRNPDGSAVTAANDARVTRVGKILRATSLDELPQLINVFKGEMSLVGPRPDQADQLSYYSEEEKRKLLVRPGLTGLAQINGRNAIPWSARKQLDVEYAERFSLLIDLQILAKTVPYVLAKKNIVESKRQTVEGDRAIADK